MSISAAQADAFYRETAAQREVWTVRDEDGFPAPQTLEGRAMPFWSLHSRAAGVVANVPAFAEFEIVSIDLDEWCERWLPGLKRDGIRVGLNWSGTSATGYDVEPDDVVQALTDREQPG